MSRQVLPADLTMQFEFSNSFFQYLRDNRPSQMRNEKILKEFQDWDNFGREFDKKKQELTGKSSLNGFEKMGVSSTALGVLSLPIDIFLLSGASTVLGVIGLLGIWERRQNDGKLKKLAELYQDATRRSLTILKEVIHRFGVFVQSAPSDVTR